MGENVGEECGRSSSARSRGTEAAQGN